MIVFYFKREIRHDLKMHYLCKSLKCTQSLMQEYEGSLTYYKYNIKERSNFIKHFHQEVDADEDADEK